MGKRLKRLLDTRKIVTKYIENKSMALNLFIFFWGKGEIYCYHVILPKKFTEAIRNMKGYPIPKPVSVKTNFFNHRNARLKISTSRLNAANIKAVK